MPGIAYWKGMIAPGRESDELFDLMDLFNTSLQLAGAIADRFPTDRYIDGIDQTSFLLADDGQSNREKVYIWNEHNLMAMRMYEYKIHVKIVEQHAQWLNIDMTTVSDVGLAPWLFNLYIDPKEEYPVGHRMNAFLASMAAEMKGTPRHSGSTRPRISDCWAVRPGDGESDRRRSCACKSSGILAIELVADSAVLRRQAGLAHGADDGSVLPFPPAPMAGVAEPTAAGFDDDLAGGAAAAAQGRAEHPDRAARRRRLRRLRDVRRARCHTPTLTRLAAEGIALQRVPHHLDLLADAGVAATGRNHTRVGSGTIAERAVALDGYTGVIPKTPRPSPKCCKHYGYHTAAFGKWHNTPATETTAIGPKDRWPNGYGFEYFYGFLGGETSQWEPRLTENYDAVEPPHDDPDLPPDLGHGGQGARLARRLSRLRSRTSRS